MIYFKNIVFEHQVSVWVSNISSAQWPQVASGCRIGSKLLLLAFSTISTRCHNEFTTLSQRRQQFLLLVTIVHIYTESEKKKKRS